MKSKLPLLLGLSTVLLATSCAASTESATKSGTTASPVSIVSESPQSPESSATATPAATSKSVSAEDLIPAFSREQTSEDRPEDKVTDSTLKPESFRLLNLMSYASQYVAVNDSDELCLLAWAKSGDQDGTGITNGPNTECQDPAVVKQSGIQLEVTGNSDQPEVVLAMLPPDLTEKIVRTELLKIPGNHEDLRPPVEFKASEDGIVSVAMEVDTARDLGKISFPRPDGTKFTLNLQ